MDAKKKRIKLCELSMWTDNARYKGELKNEKDCIITLFESNPGKSKMLAILDDIIRTGRLRETLIVFDSGTKKVVLDGNRRFAAIAIHKYQDLASTYNLQNKKITISEVDCDVYSNLDEAYDHVESRHQGEQGGKGTVPWDSVAKQRMNEIRGNETSLGYKVIEMFYESSDPRDEYVRSNIKNVSTVDRILKSSKIYKDKFGFKKISEYDLDNPEIVDGIREVFEVFYKETDGSVRSVYTNELVEKVFENIKSRSIKTDQIQLDIDDIPHSEKKEKKKNNYKSKEDVLFDWGNQSLNFKEESINWYISSLQKMKLKPTSVDSKAILYKCAPFYYRVILECALREFIKYIEVDENKSKFNAKKDEFSCFNTTASKSSLVTGNKIWNLINLAKKSKCQNVVRKIKEIKKVKRHGMGNLTNCDQWVDELNAVVHGSVINIDITKIKMYDECTLDLLKMISILINCK